MNNPNLPEDQLAKLQTELDCCRAEITSLRQLLEQKDQEIHKLIRWMQSLQQDITAVYHSMTWQSGQLITQIVLKLLRRSAGPTARDHINKTLTAFESWKINFFQNRHRQKNTQIRYFPWHDTKEYALWIKQYDKLDDITMHQMKQCLQHWSYQPVISILMPVFQTEQLEEAIASLCQQIYPHWQLCLSHTALTEMTLPKETRIQSLTCQHGDHLADLLNTALSIATGDFIIQLNVDDRLPIHALYRLVETLNVHPETQLVYTDDDKIEVNGQRSDPYFKSDWNPDLFYSQDFIHRSAIYRRALVNEIGGFRADYPGWENYDLTLRYLERIKPQHIYHIPHILYHQRKSEQTLIPEIACLALQAHFQRLQQPVKVVPAMGTHTRVIYPLPEQLPLVSIIIPTRDKLKLLRGTVEGLLQQTDYPSLELIIMDNGSVELETISYLKQLQKNARVTVIRHHAPFNYSQLNNLGVSHAKGTIIGLLNNDLEVIHADWLTEMVSHALRPEIGAVGAKLYYANDTLQHAGVIVGLGGMAGHGFRFLAKESPGYHWKPFLIQNYSAVTGACLVLRRQIFLEVGGLEERYLKVAFNDVDLCLRLRERGYRIVWTPYAELYHLESASRGLDNTFKKFIRLQRELKYMRSRWKTVLRYDPYYNPNLTLEYEDFALNGSLILKQE